MSKVCKRFLISGKVQGVWFRESARRQAERLKLSGKAINLPDGRVEVLVLGAESEIDQMATWLRQGPTMARVDHVTEETVEHTGFTGFVTG